MSSLNILIATGHAVVLAASNSATTTTAKPSSSSAATFLPFILLIAVGGYLLFIRPRNQAMKRQQAGGQQIAVGDRVLTRAGIVGRVKGFNGDRVLLEISPDVVIEVVRQGVGQKLPEELDDEDLIPPPPGAEDEDEDHVDAEHGGDAPAGEEWGQGETAGDWSPVEPKDLPDPFEVDQHDPLAPADESTGQAQDETAPAPGGRRRGRGARS